MAAALVMCSSESGGNTSPVDDEWCVVSVLNDGDTLRCKDGRRIRLLLIDAPEMAQQPYGGLALDELAALAPVGATLAVEYDVERKDTYARDLAYLFDSAGVMVNEEMVRRGYAVAFVIPPNGRYESRVRSAMEHAQAEETGLWADWGFACLPADFRAGRCS